MAKADMRRPGLGGEGRYEEGPGRLAKARQVLYLGLSMLALPVWWAWRDVPEVGASW